MATPSMRAKRSNTRRASPSPSRAIVTSARPVTRPLGVQLGGQVAVRHVAGVLGGVALERLAAAVGLHAAAAGTVAGAGRPLRVDREVTELGTQAVGPAEGLSLDHHAPADAGAEREHHEHARRGAVHQLGLGQRRAVGVVVHEHRHAEAPLELRAERDAGERDVHARLDGAGGVLDLGRHPHAHRRGLSHPVDHTAGGGLDPVEQRVRCCRAAWATPRCGSRRRRRSPPTATLVPPTSTPSTSGSELTGDSVPPEEVEASDNHLRPPRVWASRRATGPGRVAQRGIGSGARRRPMFGSVLVGTDGSDRAERAVKAAVDVAKGQGARLVIVAAYREGEGHAETIQSGATAVAGKPAGRRRPGADSLRATRRGAGRGGGLGGPRRPPRGRDPGHRLGARRGPDRGRQQGNDRRAPLPAGRRWPTRSRITLRAA